VISAFERATGIEIPYEIVGRRSGDVTAAYADPSKALQELGWQSAYNLEDMCRDAWNWQKKNPSGYP
jgi:UDP-glucose 4-epimerase